MKYILAIIIGTLVGWFADQIWLLIIDIKRHGWHNEK